MEKINPADQRSRRQRQRDSEAMGRKSRRTAARQEFARRQQEQNLRGIARVHILGHGTPAMQATVADYVERLADQQSIQTGTPFTTCMAQAEDNLRKLLVDYDELEA